MKYTVINGDISVKSITISDVAISSTFLVGDTKTISLSSSYDTPPESLIVGVTSGGLTPAVPFIPLVSPE